MFDYSPALIRDRWVAGRRDMARALGLLASAPEPRARFTYIPVEPEDGSSTDREPFRPSTMLWMGPRPGGQLRP